jgi:hypothetical protein
MIWFWIGPHAEYAAARNTAYCGGGGIPRFAGGA